MTMGTHGLFKGVNGILGVISRYKNGRITFVVGYRLGLFGGFLLLYFTRISTSRVVCPVVVGFGLYEFL